MRATAAVLAAFAVAGCGSAGETRSSGDVVTAAACEWPASADTFDPASSTGCRPRPEFLICGVPDGSFVHGDGSITTPPGTSASCENACSAAEYALICEGPAGSIAAPPPELGCNLIPIPTPSRLLFHCCPCRDVAGR